MAVNPNLAALMRVIEDHQDKMPEGEYLEAMNALGALHRQQQQQQQLPLGAPIPVAAPALNGGGGGGPPPSYTASAHLFAAAPEMTGNIEEQRAWRRVKFTHPDPHWNTISPQDWIALSHDTRYELLRNATEHYVTKLEREFCNPDPEVCAFVARHAVGLWSLNDADEYGDACWECVCGYKGKTKNWEKHEASERHQDWAKHRTVSRRKIEKMKEKILNNEHGEFISYNGSYTGASGGVYPGGIRFYPNSQERNEWTHPELFPEHSQSISGGSGGGVWFVHPRIIRVREYVA
jgi:hypothetical protein